MAVYELARYGSGRLHCLALALVCLFLVSGGAHAQSSAEWVTPGHLSVNGCPGGINPCFIPSSPAIPVSPAQFNVSVATATSLTVPTGANQVLAICTGAVNWRDDGTAPTSSVGMPLAASTLLTYAGSLSAIQFIAQSSATCNFSYYK